jgi:NADPH:quinone reductase-like Zn-dependent oxidoreductase
MRAAVHRRFGGPEVVTVDAVAVPEPGPRDILVRVHASTVSAADHRARAKDIPAGLGLLSSLTLGLFRPKRSILGMDVAGVVAAVGAEVDGFAVGDEVIAMLGGRFGGHAEYAVVTADDAIAGKPAQLGFDEAAAIVFGGITAQAYLNQVNVTRGIRVVVNGASGAVGSAMVQLAHAVGAHVTAVTSAANRDLVIGLGADEVIDYRTRDFTQVDGGYDVVVDCVGNAPVSRVATSVAPGGAVLIVAGDLRSLLTAKRDARRLGISVVTGPGAFRSEDLRCVARHAQDGTLRPVIDRTYPLDEVAEAHRYVDTGRKRGSVLLAVSA